MNIKIIIGIISIVVIGGGVLLVTVNNSNNQGDSDCAEMCQKASQACPSLVNENDCNNKCTKLSEEARKHLEESDSCEEITSRPDLIVDLIIPEVITPEIVDDKNSNGCEAACANYVGKCLTLVPNATQALFEEGQTSCMGECLTWSSSKIDCMINAFDCESMTDVCGL